MRRAIRTQHLTHRLLLLLLLLLVVEVQECHDL
jgi:hypothetical protein